MVLEVFEGSIKNFRSPKRYSETLYIFLDIRIITREFKILLYEYRKENFYKKISGLKNVKHSCRTLKFKQIVYLTAHKDTLFFKVNSIDVFTF